MRENISVNCVLFLPATGMTAETEMLPAGPLIAIVALVKVAGFTASLKATQTRSNWPLFAPPKTEFVTRGPDCVPVTGGTTGGTTGGLTVGASSSFATSSRPPVIVFPVNEGRTSTDDFSFAMIC